MILLESLSPRERAVFLLHDVFALPHAEIAEMLGPTEANCRQILRRARMQLQARRPRFDPPAGFHRLLMDRFSEATRAGDLEALRNLLAEDVVAVTDGGGKAPSGPCTGETE